MCHCALEWLSLGIKNLLTYFFNWLLITPSSMLLLLPHLADEQAGTTTSLYPYSLAFLDVYHSVLVVCIPAPIYLKYESGTTLWAGLTTSWWLSIGRHHGLVVIKTLDKIFYSVQFEEAKWCCIMGSTYNLDAVTSIVSQLQSLKLVLISSLD